jgi:peptidoglycan/xylan/chitin deacetylase (PgdA/CDA1 family)
MNLMGLFSASFYSILSPWAKSKRVSILMYHRINDVLSPSHLTISTKTFLQQMKYLKSYCDVLNCDQLLEYCQKGFPVKQKPQVLITIDDGYRDNYLNAFPVLRKLGLPATIFLATGFIGTNKRMQYYEDMPLPDMLSWQEVAEMKAHGISFGPHTVNHPHLTQLNAADQKEEIRKSMDDLNEHLAGDFVQNVFCYPYGEYNEDSLQVLKELNLKLALTVRTGLVDEMSKSLELRRICADGRVQIAEFIKMLNPTVEAGIKWRMNWIKDFRKKLGVNKCQM